MIEATHAAQVLSSTCTKVSNSCILLAHLSSCTITASCVFVVDLTIFALTSWTL